MPLAVVSDATNEQALRLAAGSEVVAVLMPVPKGPEDAPAVAVLVDRVKVGQLSRDVRGISMR